MIRREWLYCLAIVAACKKDPDPAPEPVGVTIERTAHGVAHVTAGDAHALGYGVGYAYTEDNRCLLAHRVAEVTGTLSAQLGADADVLLAVHGITYPALSSDLFYRGWLSDDAIQAGFDAGPAEVRDLARGYADGVNRFVADHPDADPCDVDFVTDVTPLAVYRMWVATAEIGSGEILASFLADSPPSARAADPVGPLPDPADSPFRPHGAFGSNAWALGRDATDGPGVHLYNPHFPWTGIHRTWMVHLTIPGDLDVMGVTIGGLPVPLAGFNAHVAWGLTFSNAARFTMDELALAPGDPLSFVVDGETRAIEEELITLDVKGAGPQQVPVYRADGHPIIRAGAYLMGWGAEHAYAARDVNADNTRMVEQFLALARAHDVGEVQEALASVNGVPWSYTTAADDAGDVFFGDLSNVPGVTAEQIADCSTSGVANALRAFGILVLDGSRSECGWTEPLPADALPWTTRTDYVANSNNSYDLPHPGAPLSGYSPILGAEGAPLDLRPTLGLRMIEDQLATGPFDGATAEAVFHETRNLAGEILAGPIAAECLADPAWTLDGDAVDLTAVCSALAGWDGKNQIDRVGPLVFAGVWADLGPNRDALFAVPPSWADPIGTPAGYTDDPDLHAAVRDSLAKVAAALDAAGIAPDWAWGDTHTVIGQTATVPVPGGSGGEGVFDVISGSTGFGRYPGWVAELDGTPTEELFGASYEHVVVLGADGPSARGLLAYSQATEPSSPWFEDQLGIWSAGAWFDFPFTADAVTADPEYARTDL